MRAAGFFTLLIVSWMMALPSFGVDEESAPASEDAQPPATSPSKQKNTSRKARKAQSKGRSANGEAEGTEAYDRFEANTVVKSRYQLNGESLEVDPD